MQGGDAQIGLALSGGGSRAIAFHLGYFRALKRLGLLDRVVVLSTVSGGSVVGAYFQAHNGDFDSFETKIREVLAQGLIKQMCRKLFSPLGLRVVASTVIIGIVAICTALVRALLKIVGLIVPRSLSVRFETFEIRSPLHRFRPGAECGNASLA
jgi:NTE family protein